MKLRFEINEPFFNAKSSDLFESHFSWFDSMDRNKALSSFNRYCESISLDSNGSIHIYFSLSDPTVNKVKTMDKSANKNLIQNLKWPWFATSPSK